MAAVTKRSGERRKSVRETALVGRDGTRTTLTRGAVGDVFRIFDGAGRLVVEHRPDEGKSVVFAPAGDLELRADHGSIDLVARDDVRLHGERGIASFAEAQVGVGSLSLAATTVVSAIGVLETRAERIVERARNVYREIEDLSQTRTGRMRTVVRSTFDVLCQRAFLKAKDDVKIKGDKIHLA